MKKLTKIKIINWHTFQNVTLDIKDNILLSGENGSGKSTLLDAMQYVLVGGRQNAHFNIAATPEAKRTLEGYIRGKLGGENKQFIRPGDVITHIALEFFDTRDEKYSIIGVVIDLPQSSSLKERFYRIKNTRIDEDMYIEDKRPRNFKSMRDYLDGAQIKFEVFDTNKQYKEALSVFLGIDGLKYSKLLPKALAFKPIDLQSFIFEFLLDNTQVNISSLKNNVAELKKIEAEIKKDREKIEALEKIRVSSAEIKAEKDEIAVNDITKKITELNSKEAIIKQCSLEKQQNTAQLSEILDQITELKTQILAKEETIKNLDRARGSNSLAQTLDGISREIQRTNTQIEAEKIKAKDLENSLIQELATTQELAKRIKTNEILKNFAKMHSQTAFKDIAKVKENLEAIAEFRELLIEGANARIYKLNEQSEAIRKEIAQLKEEHYNLERNIKMYPPQTTALVEKINEKLSQKYHREFNFRPLCDLIEVNDETWRNVAEGYIGRNKFNIIVDPEYFDDALEVYNEVRTTLNIFGVGLVNTGKIPQTQTDNDSLAGKIDTSHTYARAYINMLYNNVICVATPRELKNFSRSVEPLGMTYSNYTASQLNPQSWARKQIGITGNTKQKEIILREIEQKTQNLAVISKEIGETTYTRQLAERLAAARIIQENRFSASDNIKIFTGKIQELQTQKENLAKGTDIKEIEAQIDKAESERSQISAQHEELITRRGRIEQVLQDIEVRRNQTKETQAVYKQELEELKINNPELLSAANTKYSALLKRHEDPTKIIEVLESSQTKLANSVSRQSVMVLKLMSDYCLRYSFSKEPLIENLTAFEAEQNEIKNHNLIVYEQKAKELRDSAETTFKEEFVNKLASSIEQAKQQIDDLNVALQGKRFGKDTYKLIYKAAEDPDFERYYNLLTRNHELNNTLFQDNLNKTQTTILDDLFRQISSTDPAMEKTAARLLDYRNYMKYDIEITSEDNVVSLFSKVSREKSGGETQVPFYIVIAASFQQLLSRNRGAGSGCLVLFDEAFNNMDESRISAMMTFYNSLAIQLFIAVPPQRVANIIQYVTTSLTVVKHKELSFVKEFQKEPLIKTITETPEAEQSTEESPENPNLN